MLYLKIKNLIHQISIIIKTLYTLGLFLVITQFLHILEKEFLQHLGASSYHSGIDIPAPQGTQFIAVADGEITFCQFLGAGGYTITLSFDDEKQKTIEIKPDTVTPKNLGSGLVANATTNNNIVIQVKGVQSVIDNLKPEDINAYIDLSKYSAGDYDVDVKIDNSDPRLSYVVSNTIGIKISNG